MDFILGAPLLTFNGPAGDVQGSLDENVMLWVYVCVHVNVVTWTLPCTEFTQYGEGMFCTQILLNVFFHIPLSSTCTSPICGWQGQYAHPLGIVVAGSFAGCMFFCGWQGAGWPFTPRGRVACFTRGWGPGRSKCGVRRASSMISLPSLLAFRIRQLLYMYIYIKCKLYVSDVENKEIDFIYSICLTISPVVPQLQ